MISPLQKKKIFVHTYFLFLYITVYKIFNVLDKTESLYKNVRV